ncbi:hypothetical protein EELLY_v1c02580 [Entomoplasma ellychniae]|uniref:BspA family leucine-rich repeat surface protein n=1 Tax=Entomoplasma ellychniae TaxID=2114 RepID=A0A8E2UDZ3_9MOLU|nr:BspA family leucine-rich repeat surface protein [Entomoplasma ellychniae]PPE04578.1 hypothetical protein EELLY_v1c02580 [Entomoplasma ellychniae]
MKKKKILFAIISSLLLTVVIAGPIIYVMNKKQKPIVNEKKENISLIKDKLQNILNSKNDGEWSVEELNQAIITANIDVAGGIVVTAGEKSQNFENKRDYHEDTYIFTGNGTSENAYKYTGSINLIHEWNEVNDTTQDISKVEDKLQNILNSKTKSEWSIEELNQAIIDKKIDVDGGIEVAKAELEPLKNESTTVDQIKYTFTGKGEVNNNYKYNGSIELVTPIISGESLADNITVYQDQNGNLLQTSEMNFSNLNAVEIYKIGFKTDGSTIQNLKTVKSLPSTLPKEITSLKAFFANSSLNSIKGISNWDTSNITSMEETFNGASNFNGDISNWDTLKVTNMFRMFQNAKNFDQDISTKNVKDQNGKEYTAWDTSNVTQMGAMFNGASNFNGDISNWDTSKVTNMLLMFNGATSFNSDISTKIVKEENGEKYTAWDTSNVTQMGAMFQGASKFNQDISKWDTSKVTDMSYMFNYSSSFNQDLSEWKTSNVTNMQVMFQCASNFNGDISNWDTSKVSNMSYMFVLADSFNQDIANWNTSKVTNMSVMFAGVSSFNSDISTKIVKDQNGEEYTAWDTSNVTNMSNMFQKALSFNQDISNWNTSKVTNMSGMFCDAFSFNQDISKWDTSRVTDMTQMFWNDHYPSFNGKEMSFNQDLTNWNVSQVTKYTEFWNDENIKWDNQPIFNK